MSRKFSPTGDIAPIAATSATALLLIDAQLGFRAPFFGTPTNAALEPNISALLARYRHFIDASGPEQAPTVIHTQYRSVWTDHPMHPSHKGPYGANGEEKRGVDFLEYAAPRLLRDGILQPTYTFDEPRDPQTNSPQTRSAEIIVTKHGHSPFINTPLEHLLRERGIKTLLIAGMSTDGAVSTAVRMAHNLALVGNWGGRGNMADAPQGKLWTDGYGMFVTEEDASPLEGEQAADGYLVDMPRIVLIGDATRTFALDGIDADVVHQIHLTALKPFAEVRSTQEVLQALT